MQQPLFVTEEKRLEQEKKKIRISVRNLVEFLLRSGDLDNRRGGVSDKDAMQAGSEFAAKTCMVHGAFGHGISFEE